MDYDYFWADKDSDGQRIARNHGLKSAQPIMCSAPDSDNCLYMFQSGSKYYIWNPIEGGIWEIMTSMDLVEIVTKIAKLGLKSADGCESTSSVFRLILGWKMIELR
jgi:hypothetical protein